MQRQSDSQKKPSLRKYIIQVVVPLLLIAPVFVFQILIREPKSDAASEKTIRECAAAELTKDPNNPKNPNELTNEDFANVTSLKIGGSPHPSSSIRLIVALADIKFLENFTNLQELSLSCIVNPNNEAPGWMNVMADAGIFDVDKRFALDLSPVKKLRKLKSLTITVTMIKDIKPLSGLKNLRRLDIHGTNVSDLKPIKKLKNLEYLGIYNTQVSSLEPVRRLTNLLELDAHFTQISDLKPLLKLKKLLNLNITGCKKISNRQIEDLKRASPQLYISYGQQ